MAYLIIRADGSGEKYCEEYHATEGEMLESVTDYECQVCQDVHYVIWSNEEAKTVGRLDRDELQARITDGKQQADEERETEEFHSRASNFI